MVYKAQARSGKGGRGHVGNISGVEQIKQEDQVRWRCTRGKKGPSLVSTSRASPTELAGKCA